MPYKYPRPVMLRISDAGKGMGAELLGHPALSSSSFGAETRGNCGANARLGRPAPNKERNAGHGSGNNPAISEAGSIIPKTIVQKHA